MPPSFAQFVSIRQAYQPTFSPDGQRLAFLTNITGDRHDFGLTFAADSQSGYCLCNSNREFAGVVKLDLDVYPRSAAFLDRHLAT